MAEKDKTHGFSIRLLKEESNNVNIKSLLKIGNAEIVDNSTLPTDKKGYRWTVQIQPKAVTYIGRRKLFVIRIS